MIAEIDETEWQILLDYRRKVKDLADLILFVLKNSNN